MITCDLFELQLELSDSDNRSLKYMFYCDLPAGTRVVLSCQRTFKNTRGETCLWVGFNTALEIQSNVHGDYNGGVGVIDVDASDRKAFEQFKQINKGFSGGIQTPVSDNFTVVLTVGARQRLKAFGRNNSSLNGDMVGENGGINVVEVEKSCKIPVKDELQPLAV